MLGRQRLALAGLFVLGLVQGAANGVSRMDDLRGAGQQVSGLHLLVDEGSSLLVWYALIPVIWWLVGRLAHPRFGWPAVLAGHAALTLPISLAHVLGFVGLRHVAYALLGETYDFADDWPASLLYEYRKDAVSYALLALALAAIRYGLGRVVPPSAAASQQVIEVADGSIRHRIPLADIAWVEASGNYVALHTGGGEVLHRATLAALESELGNGFVRIHRSRLVRRDAVRRIETAQSGDFIVTLEDGSTLRGSRRYREALTRAG